MHDSDWLKCLTAVVVYLRMWEVCNRKIHDNTRMKCFVGSLGDWSVFIYAQLLEVLVQPVVHQGCVKMFVLKT